MLLKVKLRVRFGHSWDIPCQQEQKGYVYSAQEEMLPKRLNSEIKCHIFREDDM